jgi:hypothetical protein
MLDITASRTARVRILECGMAAIGNLQSHASCPHPAVKIEDQDQITNSVVLYTSRALMGGLDRGHQKGSQGDSRVVVDGPFGVT